jgi:hypothetical protein
MSNIKLLAFVLSLAAAAPAFAQRDVNPTASKPATSAAVAASVMATSPMHVAMTNEPTIATIPRHLTAEEFAPNLFVGM